MLTKLNLKNKFVITLISVFVICIFLQIFGYIRYQEPKTVAIESIGKRTLALFDDTNAILWKYDGNGNVKKINFSLSDHKISGKPISIGVLPNDILVFSVDAGNFFEVYKWKIGEKDATKIVSLEQVKLDTWDKAYREHKVNLDASMPSKTISIWGPNFIVTGSTTFAFDDAIISGVDGEKVSEVTERRREFDISGTEKERALIKKGSSNNSVYKSFEEASKYTSGVEPINIHWFSLGNYDYEVGLHPFLMGSQGRGHRGIFIMSTSSTLAISKDEVYLVGRTDSCRFGDIFVFPKPHVCNQWYEDTIYLEKKYDDSATSSRAVLRTASVSLFSDGSETYEYDIVGISNDKNIAIIKYTHNGKEPFVKYYGYIIDSDKVVELPSNGFIGDKE